MHIVRGLTRVAATLILIGINGCVQPPMQETNNARAAIEAARASEAMLYAGPLFSAAGDSLDSALVVIHLQKKRIFRDYSRALAQLNAAVEIANASKKAAAVGKEQMRTEAQADIVKTVRALDECIRLHTKAKKEKKDVDLLDGQLDEIRELLEQSVQFLQRNQISPARRYSREALDKTVPLKTALELAPAETRIKKEK